MDRGVALLPFVLMGFFVLSTGSGASPRGKTVAEVRYLRLRCLPLPGAQR